MNPPGRRGLVAGVTAGLLAFTGVSFAAFSSTTSFTITATTAAGAQPLGITAEVSGPLRPGFLEDVRVTLSNPHDTDVTVDTVTVATIRYGGGLTSDQLAEDLAKLGELSGTTVPAGQQVTRTVTDVLGLAPTATADGGTVTISMSATSTAAPGNEVP